MIRVVVLCLCVTLAGCTINANLATGYRAETGAAVGAPPRRVSVAVRRFKDERPPRVYTTLGRGFLTYVPLIPYVAFPYERLDESARKAGEEVGAAMPAFEEYT